MGGVRRFEDLIAWQKARLQMRDIHFALKRSAASRDFDFCPQIRSAALSVMSNIAEGFEWKGNNEVRHFLSIAGYSNG